nr:site-specific integrase [Roseicella aerolata]
MFTPDELRVLFSSPVWRGRHHFFREKEGPEIIRDGFFWLPILALYHGARLEELADLKRRDLRCDGGVWCINITEADGRRLKNGNADRVVPLHPEVIRMGFLEDALKAAPTPDAPLFPDLPQRGKDKRRGVDVTKWFTRYRRKFGLDRPGLSFHSFRHTAITRLTDAITTEQQRRHRDRMMGHASGGGEGDQRYDKGPGLKALAETLALLRFPEVDLSHLYTAERTA